MGNEITIRKRSEIPVQDTWALEDLYATDELWEQELLTLQQDQDIMVKYAGRLGESGQSLYAYLQIMENVDVKLSLLGNYCTRRSDEDTRNAVYQSMQGKFYSTAVALNTACSFETPELMSIDENVLEGFYRDCPGLERYRRFLSNIRRRKTHTLSEAEERILAAAGEIGKAPTAIYEAFTDADMKYPDAVDMKGNKHPLSRSTFVKLEESSDRELRRSAYHNLYQTIANYQNTAAALLNAQNKQLKFYAQMRKYPTALDAALDASNVPAEVYYNLISAVHQNLDKMHRYVRLRKKLLGVDQLYYYDIYTPLLKDVDKSIPFEQAKRTVYDALYPLGEEYRTILKAGFENRWIDVYENEGKRSGAYSAGTMVHPYVLLNYSENLNSQFTLAHEMGHALHSYYSDHAQNPIDSRYVIFVAEVASTCNEALLMDYLLKNTTEKTERAYLINYFLDQIKGTIYRQTMFAEFELYIGELIDQGLTLTAEILNAEYKRLNQLYYGPDMQVDDSIALEWARVPHFYYNYYVYQYATGYSAAIALSRRILKEGESAVNDYLCFLSGGCSKTPIDLLKRAGVDMLNTKPVNDALTLFGELLDEMERIMEE